MDSSKITVLLVVVVIAGGVTAWTWVNLYQTPDYDPEMAEEFVDHFYIDCNAEHSDETCNETIGHHHRDCFTENIEQPPSDEVEKKGPVFHDRPGYLDCMDRALQSRLNEDGR